MTDPGQPGEEGQAEGPEEASGVGQAGSPEEAGGVGRPGSPEEAGGVGRAGGQEQARGRGPRDSDLWGEGPSENLRRRSVRSGAAQLGAQPIKIGLFVASGMALARLLTPADFGIYAMAMTWIALLMSIQDFGFSAAVLHGDSVDDAQLSGLFWTNVKLSLWMLAASIVMAPFVAWFYGEAAVAPVTLAMATGLLAASLGSQHQSLLMRQLRFHTTAVIEVTAVAVSVTLSVAAALLDAGYWALVIQFVFQAVTRSVGLWITVEWRPLSRSSVGPDRARIRSFLLYGQHYTVTRLVRHVGRNIDRVLVAAVGGARPAGLYDNAYRWAHYPVVSVFMPLLNVAVSTLSRTRSSAARYVAGVQDGMLPLLSAVLPALAFIAIEARPAILVLLGDQWVDAIPLFRLLALAGFARSLVMVTRWLYLSEGRTRRQLQWAVIETAIFIPAVSVGVWLDGAHGVAVAFMVATWALVVPEIAFCLVGSPVGAWDYVAGMWRPLVATAVAVGVLVAIEAPAGGADVAAVTTLAVRLVLFGLAYVAVWLALPGRRRAVGRVVRLVKDLRG